MFKLPFAEPEPTLTVNEALNELLLLFSVSCTDSIARLFPTVKSTVSAFTTPPFIVKSLAVVTLRFPPAFRVEFVFVILSDSLLFLLKLPVTPPRLALFSLSTLIPIERLSVLESL